MRTIKLLLRLVSLLGLWAFSAAGLAASSTSDAALAAVTNYSKAYMRLDVDTVASLSHPILMLRAGGEKPFRSMLKQAFESFSTLGFEKGSEVVGSGSNEFSSGRTRMIGYPAIRKTPGTGTIAMVYVAVSYDEGKAWSVFALTCTDQHWLKAIAPDYTGSPDILGASNPTAMKAIAGEDFDESVYLKGTRWITNP